MQGPRGRVFYKVLETVNYQSLKYGYCIKVFEGFLTDFASVPRVPFVYAVFGNDPRSRGAATIHDAICRYQLVDRKTCDGIFLEALRDAGMSKWKSWIMWVAVRLFGGYGDTIPNDGLAEKVQCEKI